MERIKTPNTERLYELEVQGVRFIQVEANTSNEAMAIARKAGYEIRSVNRVA